MLTVNIRAACKKTKPFKVLAQFALEDDCPYSLYRTSSQGVAVAVKVAVSVFVTVGVLVRVEVGVLVAVRVLVAVAVFVVVGVDIAVGVLVAVGEGGNAEADNSWIYPKRLILITGAVRTHDQFEDNILTCQRTDVISTGKYEPS